MENVLKKAKPIREAGMDMLDTQPVCRPKYIFEKQMMMPTAMPTRRPRIVKFWGAVARVLKYSRAELDRCRDREGDWGEGSNEDDAGSVVLEASSSAEST